MNKEQIVNIVIERAWYKSILDFVQRAYQITDEEMGRYINGCKPDVREQDREQIMKDLELEETKAEEENTTKLEPKSKNSNK